MERKENERVATLADIAWDEAMKIDSQAKAAKVSADRTKTEGAYNELHRLAQNASNAWFKAIEAKKVILSKISEADKFSLHSKIAIAESNKSCCDQLATEAIKNAKEVAKKEAERLAQEKAVAEAKAEAARKLREAQEIAEGAWNKALEMHNKAQQVKDQADATRTEHAYTQMAHTDKATGEAWAKAVEAKKAILSKIPEANRSDLLADIEIAEKRRGEYMKRAGEALEQAKEAAKNEKLQAQAREKATKLRNAQESWNTFVNEYTAAGEKYRLVIDAANQYFAADATATRAIATYYSGINGKLGKAHAYNHTNHPTNFAAQAAIKAASDAASNLFTTTNAYSFAIERVLFVAQRSSGIEIVGLTQNWTNILNALTLEKNVWNSMTSYGLWKVYADQYMNSFNYWGTARDAWRRWSQSSGNNYLTDAERLTSASKSARAQAENARTSATLQFTEAQNATRTANQAFQVLKVAMDIAIR